LNIAGLSWTPAPYDVRVTANAGSITASLNRPRYPTFPPVYRAFVPPVTLSGE
jgi:hypothetical protein